MTLPAGVRSLPALVEDAARRYGAAEAVVDGAVRVSFAALAEQVERAARGYVAAGVAAGERVAVWAPNGLPWIVAALGALRAGAALVPMNTRYRGDEAAYVLARSGARALVCAHGFLGADHLGMLARAGVDLDAFALLAVTGADAPAGARRWDDVLAGAPDGAAGEVAARAAALGPDDVSDVMFTSGSTGRPKGAMLTHGQTLRVFDTWCDLVGLRTGDRCLVVNPFFHTFGYKAGVVAGLLRGATVLPVAVFDPAAVLALVAAERITVLPGAPALFADLLDHPDRAGTDLSTLRLALTGGAVVPVELVHRLRDQLSFRTVLTGYGLTETNGTATMCDVDDPPETVASSCGRPIPDTELVVVGSEGRPVAAGTPGEVWIRGYHVMRGYLDDPAATAATVDPDGWLHTGDVGVLDQRGYLTITDRLKDMVVVGGFNVYPAEVEQAMRRHPGVARVAVVGVPDRRLGEVAVAYVVERAAGAVDPAELLTWCRQEMANVKAPRAVHLVDALPLNASGKVDKPLLRAQAAAARGAGHGDVREGPA